MSISDAQNTKKVLLLPPQLKDDGDFAGNTYADTKGWGYAEFLIATGTIDAAMGSTAEGTAPIIEECDTSGGSYTELTGAALADAIAATDDDSLFQIDVDLINVAHKRFMRIKAPHAGNGAVGVTACGIAILSKPELGPQNAAARGLAEHVIV